jgi:hypothetical protein
VGRLLSVALLTGEFAIWYAASVASSATNKMQLIRISLSTAIVLHEFLAPLHDEAIEPQPHIDTENKSPECRKAIVALASGGSSGSDNYAGELPGRFRQRTLYNKSLRVKKTRNKRERLELLDAFVDTARELAETYPYLKQWERQMHFQMFQSEVRMKMLRTRGCQDFSAALPLVARHLDVPAWLDA